MNTQHTPGPWHLGHSCDGFRTVTDGTKTLCTVGEADIFPQVEADARLIAAAPDLLAVVEEMRECLAELQDNGFAATADWGRLGKADTRAKSAIAKAKGGL